MKKAVDLATLIVSRVVVCCLFILSSLPGDVDAMSLITGLRPPLSRIDSLDLATNIKKYCKSSTAFFDDEQNVPYWMYN